MLTAKAPTAALRKYVWSQGLLKVIDTTALVLFLLAVASTGGGGGGGAGLLASHAAFR